ncbi:MAG: hypothetical protein ACTSU0_06950 [Alphaproteobacteria bacterium]
MDEHKEALTEITLAIADAAARCDDTFGETLGTTLRQSLRYNADDPQLVGKTMRWLRRFEGACRSQAARRKDR